MLNPKVALEDIQNRKKENETTEGKLGKISISDLKDEVDFKVKILNYAIYIIGVIIVILSVIFGKVVMILDSKIDTLTHQTSSRIDEAQRFCLEHVSCLPPSKKSMSSGRQVKK